jgi:hypothetical protein
MSVGSGVAENAQVSVLHTVTDLIKLSFQYKLSVSAVRWFSRNRSRISSANLYQTAEAFFHAGTDVLMSVVSLRLFFDKRFPPTL